MRATIAIDVPGLPPTPNARLHWRKLAKSNKLFKDSAFYLAVSVRPEQPWTRVEVTYTWHSPLPTDLDNITAACKPILDGVVAASVIPDDGPYVVQQITSRWEKCPRGKGHVGVLVRQLENGV